MRKSFAFYRQCQFAKRFRLFGDEKWSDRWRAMQAAEKTPSRVAGPSMCWNGIGVAISGSPRWFSWAWTRDGERVASINVETQRHAVTLKYRSRSYGEDWSDVEQRVAIEWTSCRFGGERPWFVCSVAANGVYCGRRVTKLYGAGRLFACRHCYRLAYASQQEIGPSARAWEIAKDPNAAGRKREHA